MLGVPPNSADREFLLVEAATLLGPGHEAEVLLLVADYQAAEQAWRAMPRRREAKEELGQLADTLERAATLADNMRPAAAELVYGERHGEVLGLFDRHARHVRERLAWLEGACGAGGAGHLGHAIGLLPPRFALARSAAAALERHRPGSVTSTVHGPLYWLVELVLTLAGEEAPERGLAGIVKAAAAAHRSGQESPLLAG
jgi:hypothetical protein